MHEDYFAKFSEKISLEINRGENNKIMGELSNLNEFLHNSQVLVESGNKPRPFRDLDSRKQELIDDRSQDDPNPGVVDGEEKTPHIDFRAEFCISQLPYDRK